MSTIPVLTVRQPWALAFFKVPADQAKSVENRTWLPRWEGRDFRGRLAIHAGAQLDPGGMEFLHLRDESALERSVILGTVEVVGAHVAGTVGCDEWGCRENPWAFHPLEGQRLTHWNVEHAREFQTPIPAAGKLQLWEPGPSIAYLLETAEVLS